jgi:SAM-dependent methyltransferase
LGNFIPLDTETKNVLRAKIHHYGDWRYPALLMGCRSVDWIDAMVQYDPLYLSNYDLKDTVNALISSYTEIYQRRLRIYSISNHDYSILPQNQFGVIVALDYLNYITASDIEKCLGEVYNMLRPGGVFVFSYNNCDIPVNAELTEHGAMSYYSSQQLKIIAKQLGFEIIQLDDIPIAHDDYPYISTAELRRPGKLQSIRLNQVLGRIGHK